MSLGSTKKTTSNTTQQQSGTTADTATTSPNIFGPAAGPTANYYSALGDLGANIAANPYAYTAAQNPLQTQAYKAAQNLGGWQGLLGNANSLAAAAGTAGPNTYQSPTLADAVTFGGASSGPAAQATAQGYNVANLGNAQGYNAPQLGPAAQAQAASLLDNFNAYLNPATQSLVDTTLSDYDADASRQRAAQQAAAARGGAFGGSRYGVAQGALEGELARGRAATDANLRFNAFNTAAGLAGTDADRRQNVGMFNTGQSNNMAVAQGGFDADAARYGADANNQFALNRFGAQNTANQFGAQANNTASMFNAGEQNTNARADASNATQAGVASMNAQNQRNQMEAQLAAQAGMFNAGQADTAMNRALQAAGLLSNNAGLFGSQSVNDVNAMLGAGNSMWDVQNATAQAPLQAYGAWNSLLNPGLIDTLSGQTINSNGTSSMYGTGTGTETQKSSGGLLGSLGGLLSLGSMLIPGGGAVTGGLKAAAKLSDRHAKTDIRQVGTTYGGLPIFTYRYKGDDTPQMGVMAQDVELMQPHALGPVIGGLKTVLYGEVR